MWKARQATAWPLEQKPSPSTSSPWVLAGVVFGRRRLACWGLHRAAAAAGKPANGDTAAAAAQQERHSTSNMISSRGAVGFRQVSVLRSKALLNIINQGCFSQSLVSRTHQHLTKG